MSNLALGTYPASHAVNAVEAKAKADPRLYDALIRAAQYAREMDWPGDEESLRAAAATVSSAVKQ